MTLDEAIAHCREKGAGDGECAEDHAQLASWLSELRLARGELRLVRTEREKLAMLVREMLDEFCDGSGCGFCREDCEIGDACHFVQRAVALGCVSEG